MKREIKIHPVWIEYQKLKNRIKTNLLPPQIMGKNQHIFSSDKGAISCIKLRNYFQDGKDLYEIYILKTELDIQIEKAEKERNKQKIMEIKSFIKLNGNPKIFEDFERFGSYKSAKARCQEILE